MKAWAIITKNLKLLFRSKESAFTIIFGPLLIILLVSAAYTGGGDESVIRVGTYAPEYTPLADQVISALKEEGYLVSTYSEREDCIDPIRTARQHTCIIFPEDFKIQENKSNEVVFAVDYSRINLVHQIIEDLASHLNVQSDIISENIAGDILERVALAQQEISEQITAAQAIDNKLGEISAELDGGREELGSVDVNVSFADLRDIRGHVTGLGLIIADIEVEATDRLAIAIEALRKADRDCDNCSEETEVYIEESITKLLNATATINEIADDAPDKVTQVSYLIDDAANAVEKVRDQFGALVSASSEADSRMLESVDMLDEVSNELGYLRGKLQRIDTTLQQSLSLSAVGVATPITTRTEPVNSEEGNLTFTYPYLLMLVIMFLGMMINSTLIVMDKTSKAAFRNFTTATRDEYQVIMSFVTTFLILFVQTMIILLVSYFFVKASLFSNFGVSFVIIFFAISLFSFLGMILGYLSGTHEAAMISSLSLGSVLLFISNLVLPLEAMNGIVQSLSIYNPYVVLSELLKQSMLFDLKLVQISGKIAVLIATLVVLFGLILGVQRSFRRKYFQRRSGALNAETFAAKPIILKDRDVNNLFDLRDILDSMTRAEFEEVVNSHHNPIATWVKKDLRERRLARKLDTTSKEKMILVLDKYLKKNAKKMKK